MKSTRTRMGLAGIVAPFVLTSCVFAMLLTVGCTQTPLTAVPDNTNGDDGNPPVSETIDEIAGSITGLNTLDRRISALDQPLDVPYVIQGVPQTLHSFYVQVADASPGAVEIGERIVQPADLAQDASGFISFDPRIVPNGAYRIGLIATVGGESVDILSLAAILVEGPPDPVFVAIIPSDSPSVFVPGSAVNEPTVVIEGETVEIKFDAQDPEGDVSWRLYFMTASDSRAVSPDQRGTPLATGQGNTGTFVFTTQNLPPGDYEIGLAAVDTGDSVATAVTKGDLARIITNPQDGAVGPIVRVLDDVIPLPPTVVITSPGAGGVALFRDEAHTLQFAATINEPGAIGRLDVFYDLDTNRDNGFSLIASDLPHSTTTFPFPTDVPEGVWNIGVTINDGINAPVTSYANGTIEVVRTVTLEVTAPNTNLPVAPSTPTTINPVSIAWATSAPTSAGSVDVFAQTVDASGVAFGPEIPILTGDSLTTLSATFSSSSSGVFEISVRLNLADGSEEIRQAPQRVRVSSLPAVVWLGDLGGNNPTAPGAVFQGVNFEDNAGSSFSTIGDLDNDGVDEFVITSRYGKPFFSNPDGVGPGEAYLIYGGSGVNKLSGEYNLNSVGTDLLRGVTLTGIRTPQNSDDTDGMSSVSRIPDVDGDGLDEIVFGFPNTDSRGHNVDPEQDGVVDPRSLASLEREKQFKSGGVVMVSSRNSILGDPTIGTPVINLDLVGQDFIVTCVDPEPEVDTFYQDPIALDPLAGCINGTDGFQDANGFINFGFVKALARDYFQSYVYPNFTGNFAPCGSVTPYLGNPCLPYFYMTGGPTACEPSSPGLHRFVDGTDPDNGFPLSDGRSGFYVTFFGDDGQGNAIRNDPVEPLGARIIGVANGDRFGRSLTLSQGSGSDAGDIMISAPGRTARGILMGPMPAGCTDPPSCGGEIDGLTSSLTTAKTNNNSGVAYLFGLRSLWTDDGFLAPPRPHQYIVGEASHCGGIVPLIPNIDALRIAGFPQDKITNILGIDDFNGDGRDDFAVGAPDANGGLGRIYLAYRREQSIEGDYVLEKLALDPNDSERLDGMLIVSNTLDALGSSLATGFDFNGDGAMDIAVGSPNASGGIGEVIIIFGKTGVISGLNGLTVDNLLSTNRTLAGLPVAARITGNPLDGSGNFGSTIVNAGDVDGDGLDDLLIAAPNATPRFDPFPTDSVDALTEPGVDTDFDGVNDAGSDLLNAGLVYLISSRNRLDQIPASDITISVDQLGTNNLRGFMIAGRRSGDRIGGGDAGDVLNGGNAGKAGRGRGDGLAAAGDVDGDGRADILIGSVLADPRPDPNTGEGLRNAGEAYLLYGSVAP